VRAPRLITRVAIAAGVVAGLLSTPAVSLAQAGRYALVIEGTSGGDEYAAMHRHWLDAMVKVLREKFGYDAAHLTVLAETPVAGEARSTAENLRAALDKIAKALKPADQLFVMLIGHGGGDTAVDAKFNLVGPDLTVGEWNALLKPIEGRLVFVDATSSSFPFLAGLAAEGRVIITATSSLAQHFHTAFPESFIQAFSTEAADLDKNGRTSMWEAFAYASRQVGIYYEQKGQLATEHSLLDDNFDGKGRDAGAKGEDGLLSGMTYLDPAPGSTSSDPAVQAMIGRRDELVAKVDDLRLHKKMMSAEDYDAAFEKLIIDLATVSRDIRRRTGG
jgi:hypothetical protein